MLSAAGVLPADKRLDVLNPTAVSSGVLIGLEPGAYGGQAVSAGIYPDFIAVFVLIGTRDLYPF